MEPEFQPVPLEDVSDGLPPVSLDTGVSKPAPSQPVASERAMKASVTGVTGKTSLELQTDFMNGMEAELREQMASELDARNASLRQMQVQQYAYKKQAPLTKEEVAGILDPSRPINRKTETMDVIERAYSKRVIDSLDTLGSEITGTWLLEAKKELPPEVVSNIMNRGLDGLSYIQFARTKRQDAHDAVQRQSWPGYIADAAKSLFPGYEFLKLSGWTDKSSRIDKIGLTGESLAEQAENLLMMPYEQYTKKYNEIMENLIRDNPQLAEKFADAVLGQTRSERWANNLFFFLDAGGVVAPFGIRRGVGVRTTEGALGRKIELFNDTTGAVKSTVRGAANFDQNAETMVPGFIDPATDDYWRKFDVMINEVAGNTAEASVRNVVQNIENKAAGISNPAAEAVGALTDNLRIDKDSIAAAPGSLSRGQTEDLLNATDGTMDRIIEVAEETAKVNRIPVPTMVEAAVRELREAIKDWYPGFKSAILDVSRPILEPNSNTWWYTLRFGNNRGELFTSRETAEQYAKLHGMLDARIGSEATTNVGGLTRQLTDRELKRKASLEATIKEAEEKTLPAWRKQLEAETDPAKKTKLQEDIQGTEELVQKYKTDLEQYGNVKETPGKTYYHGSPTSGIQKFDGDYVYLTEDKVVAEKFAKTEIMGAQKDKGGTKSPTVYEVKANVPENKILDLRKKEHRDAYEKARIAYNKTLDETDVDNRLPPLTSGGFIQSPAGLPGYGRAKLILDVMKQFDGIRVHESAEFGNSLLVRANKTDIAPPGGVGAEIKQQGLGWYVEVTKPLNETESVLRDLLLKHADAESAVGPQIEGGLRSWFNAAVGKFRTPEDTLSLNERNQRLIATFAQNRFTKALEEDAKYLSDVARGYIRVDPVTLQNIPWYLAKPRSIIGKFRNRQVAAEFETALDYSRIATDPDTGLPGYFFKSPAELEDYYMRTFSRMPSFNEHQAYFAMKRLVEADRVFRNLNLYRNKARLGVEQHKFSFKNKDGQLIEAPFFEGVVRRSLPVNDDNMLVIHNGKESVVNAGRIPPEHYQRIKKDIEGGRKKIIEIYDTDARPLANVTDKIGNQRIRYVITDNVETKALSWEQVPRRGGGHFVYDYPYFIKQAMVHREVIGKTIKDWYEGDRTLMPMLNAGLGKDIIKHLENARRMMFDNDMPAAQAYVRANLPIEWDEFRGWFFPKKGPDGRMIPAQFSLEEPFQLVRNGKSIFDISKNALEGRYRGTFVDGSKRGSLAKNYQVQFTGERDAIDVKTITNKGTQSNPVYNYEPAKLTDFIHTMNKSLNKIVNSSFMDDYKIYGMEHWLREAEPFLKDDLTEIRSSPFWYFNNIGDNMFKGDTPLDVKRNLLANHQKIKQFIGIPSTFDTFMASMTQKLVDSNYIKFGPQEGRNTFQKTITVVPEWMLARISDPVDFVRGVTYHFKLGLFAVPQLIVQNMTYATIFALDPVNATKGSFATLLHQWSRLNKNPAILAKLDDYATKLGWKPGEWLEANRLLDKTGFGIVRREVTDLDQTMRHSFINNDWNNFLELGQVPFREGERNVRFGAWYTSYRQWRDKNPTGPVGKAGLEQILQGANLLNTNMSRASSSMLHQGVFSLTTQFLSYQIRLAELFFSRRIGETVAERTMARARLFGVYSALFGVPTAFGLTGYPAGDHIKKWAIENGYVVGDSWVESTIMHGLPALMAALVTGGGNPRKGNWYNIDERYGAQGFTQAREALRSDVPWWTIIGGASFSTFAGMWQKSDGFYNAMISGIRGDGKFTLKLHDIVDPFKEISSLNQLDKLIFAFNTGKWMTKNEGYIGEVTGPNAVFMSLTGLQPSEVNDMWTKTWSKKDELEMQKKVMKEVINEFRRGHQAAQDRNYEQMHDFYKRAFGLLEGSGYPRENWGIPIALANKGFETMIEGNDYKYYMDDVPEDKKQIHLDAYKRKQRLIQERKQ